jgi:membrane protein
MVLLATQINLIIARLGLTLLAPVITVILSVVPYILIWFLLTFIYIFLPNAKVGFRSGLFGGVLAGTFFVIVQWVYINFQVGVASYNAIYGSFAALPLFLIWINASWIIVLFGIEIVYAHQNQETYAYEHEVYRLSASYRRLLSLQVAHLLVANFKDGGRPLRGSQVSGMLEIPRRIVMEILDSLVRADLAIGIPLDDQDKMAYQPAKDIDLFTISYVVEALEDAGIDSIPVAKTESLERISGALAAFRKLIEHSEANTRLRDL